MLLTLITNLNSLLKMQPTQIRVTKINDEVNHVAVELSIQSDFNYQGGNMASNKNRFLEVLYLTRLKVLIDQALMSNKINLGTALRSFESEVAVTDVGYTLQVQQPSEELSTVM